MNLLSQIMSEEANEGELLVRVATLSNQLTLYLLLKQQQSASPRG